MVVFCRLCVGVHSPFSPSAHSLSPAVGKEVSGLIPAATVAHGDSHIKVHHPFKAETSPLPLFDVCTDLTQFCVMFSSSGDAGGCVFTPSILT